MDAHSGAVETSLRTLSSRVNTLKRLLRAIQEGTPLPPFHVFLSVTLTTLLRLNSLIGTPSGKVPPNYRLLRQISSLCSMLPAEGAEQAMDADLVREYSDSLVVSYLACVQKSTAALKDLAATFMFTHGDRHSRMPQWP